ncbi:uncharacterized protein [Centruroides vittatus]|uniref:uncharacterized protein n=1 Tax=Centruroides vittatus TaxID=120091 RepID=UPI00350EB3B1
MYLYCLLVPILLRETTGLQDETKKIISAIGEISTDFNANIIPAKVSLKSRRPRSIKRYPQTICTPWDSCKDRCGEGTLSPPYSCYCDSLCSSYGDCCIDYEEACHTFMAPSEEHRYASCYTNERLPQQIYIGNYCPANFTSTILNKKCSSKLGPVTSSNGRVYLNTYCAHCNGERKNLSLWLISKDGSTFDPPKLFPEPRMCFNAIEKCSKTGMKFNNEDLNDLCRKFTGPVSGGKSKLFYKNIFCAYCNGEDLRHLSCPMWSFNSLRSLKYLESRLQKVFSEEKLQTLSRGKNNDNIPAAFSILLNFGLDGKERMMFSSEDEEEIIKNQRRCGKSKIWDPFSNICRTLYCSTEYVLIDFKCVPKSEVIDNTDPNERPEMIDVDSNCIHLKLSFDIEFSDLIEHNISNECIFKEQLQESLALFFQITANRIQDMNITLIPYNTSNDNYTRNVSEDIKTEFEAEFKLCESTNSSKKEPSVDNIVSMMASSVSLDAFYLDIANVKSKVSQIHQSIDTLSTWCSASRGGQHKEYWNQDFTLILNNDNNSSNMIKELYINKTGKTFSKGQFVANILFQGSRHNENLINVSGFVIVCEHSRVVLDPSCPRLKLEKNEYKVLQNGTLIYTGNSELGPSMDLSVYERVENNSVLVCYNITRFKNWMKQDYVMEFDKIQAYLSLILSCVSITALVIVLFTYIFFSKLRNLPGWNTIFLTTTILLMQITFLLGQRGTVKGTLCQIVGILIHFEILASLFWMNIMAYDLYKTFGNKNTLNFERKITTLFWYILYAYGMPAVIVLFSFLMDNFNPNLGAFYGYNDICWITNSKAALVFFAFPLAIIVVVNILLFSFTVRAIKAVQKMIRSKSDRKQKQNDAFLYLRMATVMGFTWILAFLAAWYPRDKLLGEILAYLFIIFNTLQGLFIFFGFVCNKRILRFYKDKITSLELRGLKTCSSCGKFRCVCQTKQICRSSSTETTFNSISESVPTLISFKSV